MPIYEYRCDNDHTFEVTQSMSEDALDECTICGAPARRILFAPAVHFKGSGFYTTDYARKGAAKSANGSDAKADSKDSKGSDSKSSSDSGSSGSSGSSGTSSSGSGDKATTKKDGLAGARRADGRLGGVLAGQLPDRCTALLLGNEQRSRRGRAVGHEDLRPRVAADRRRECDLG